MRRYYIFSFLLLLSLLVSLNACKKKNKTIEPVPSPSGPIIPGGVSVDLTLVPYAKLSDYHFFTGELKEQVPASGVVPYKLASALFTDYALKKRFIYIPSGSKGTYVADAEILNLPVGSAILKTFYYDNVQPSGNTKIVETRVMIRKSNGWIFANYVWNSEQTEAFLDMNGSYLPISWQENGVTKSTSYRIPSETECLICHKSNSQPIPIGIKPQNLNVDYTYASGTENQLQKWVALGLIENNLPNNIVSTIDYTDDSYPLRLRLRSYLDINCAHCHRQNSHCDYRPIRLAFTETAQSVNMGICVSPGEAIDPSLIEIIVPGNYTKSVMHFRLNSADENNRMPLLGRTLVHTEGVQLLQDFISSISNCN